MLADVVQRVIYLVLSALNIISPIVCLIHGAEASMHYFIAQKNEQKKYKEFEEVTQKRYIPEQPQRYNEYADYPPRKDWKIVENPHKKNEIVPYLCLPTSNFVDQKIKEINDKFSRFLIGIV